MEPLTSKDYVIVAAHLTTLIAIQQDIPSADQLMIDIIDNIKSDGICKHFLDLFKQGQGVMA